MPRHALHSEDIKIEQKPVISDDPGERKPDVVLVEDVLNKDYVDELAFNEEPVQIRLEPSAEKNAPTSYPFWVNGKGCEVMIGGRWREMIYIPVGQVLTVKRKYLAVMATAKFDSVETVHGEAGQSENIPNNVSRKTSGVTAFSVIEDKNPRGAAWLSELRRRNF